MSLESSQRREHMEGGTGVGRRGDRSFVLQIFTIALGKVFGAVWPPLVDVHRRAHVYGDLPQK
jgi:hypothetical protein